MNLFIDIQVSKTLPRVFIALWALFIAGFGLFVFSQYALLTSLILLLVGMLVFLPCVLWQQKAFNHLNQGVQQLQFVDGCWYLVEKSGSDTERHSIELANDNVLWPWWIKLNYKLEQDQDDQSFMSRFSPHKRQQLLICRDAVSETDFRHLSRVLRFYRNEERDQLESN
ncbi:MAG TPA: protein YgfX [Kangiella sp.]